MRILKNLSQPKPLTYSVGEAGDGGTLEGVAKLVYGNQKMWVQIFEANRALLGYPDALQAVEVIKGDPLLANAATDAVRQWKYRSLAVKGRAVNKFVVVLTFDKHGKAH
ncbi:MAG TPA: hypothetical protein VF740_09655 [Candidatus Acidoferrum sp.]